MGIINTLNFITKHPLNERRKLKAVRHWLSWQIGSRLVPGPVAVDFVNDTMLLVSPGMTGATGNVYTGLHEFQDMAFVLHLLRQGDTFVDVGANVGAYTVLAGVVNARCISIEPIKSAFDHLILNIRLNGIGNIVDARNIGISSHQGILKFTKGLDTVNHVAVGSEASGIALSEVEVDTLDNVIAEVQPVLIKIDVEGFETEVVAGAERVLSKKSLLAVIMELNGSGQRYNYNEWELYKRMIDYGFTPCSYIPFGRSLEVLNEEYKPAGNTLFVKDLEAVKRRLEIAPPFSVGGESI
jgi:FkbM family methyltransferase